MTRPATVRAYEALLILYPRSFRREYGEDMSLMFSMQLRDENTVRVCARAGIDLALTIPTRYLETVMKTATSPFLSVLFGAVAIAGLIVAVVSGTNVTLALSGAAATLLAGGLSLASHRRSRPLGASTQSGGWWKLLVASGGGVFGALIVAVNVTGEVPDDLWLPMVITGLTALVLMAMGLILGVVRIATTTTRHGSAS